MRVRWDLHKTAAMATIEGLSWAAGFLLVIAGAALAGASLFVATATNPLLGIGLTIVYLLAILYWRNYRVARRVDDANERAYGVRRP